MRSVGTYGESIATKYLINNGYKIITNNFYTRYGELDIIAIKQQYLHVIEVKLLKKQYIHSGYKLNYKKRRRMIQCTQLLLDQYKISGLYIQFDLIAITNNQVDHIKNIFTVSDV